MVNFDADYFIYAVNIEARTLITKMNSAFAKVSNLKVNRFSKIVISLASSTFFFYALGFRFGVKVMAACAALRNLDVPIFYDFAIYALRTPQIINNFSFTHYAGGQ